ncbi:MAG: hypothetical protein JWP12_1856 [Bacteroidetes bacterium]|nr:hypothetical protein [Bacteroidota bacterium]
MGYKELVDIEDGLDLDPLILERTPCIQKLVDDFIRFYENKYKITVSTTPDTAEIISSIYFSLFYKDVKPAVNNKANRFKMASLMELVIIKTQLLICPGDEAENKKLNALFAMNAALSLIDCMINNAEQEFFCDTKNTAVDKEIEKILDDHRLWLETKQVNEMPVFINAQFYELIEFLHKIPIQIHAF